MTHKEWWLKNTEDGQLYDKLHSLQGNEKAYEQKFWIDGRCPKCNHNAPNIYKPDLLEASYMYECQRKCGCYYECSIVVDDEGKEDIRKMMMLKIEKLGIIKRLIEIDSIIKPYVQTIQNPYFYFLFEGNND